MVSAPALPLRVSSPGVPTMVWGFGGGASPMASSKSLLALSPPVSVAVMRSCSVPAALASGVPRRVRVAASNTSQEGKAAPEARLAV